MNITGVIDVRNAFVCWITVAVVIDVIIVVAFGGVAVLLVVRGSYYYC